MAAVGTGEIQSSAPRGAFEELEIMRVMKIGSEIVALAGVALLMAGSASPTLAATTNQVTFKSAEDASNALFLAVKTHDQPALARVLGAGSELADSDDAVQDRLDREQFVQKYQQMHRLVREAGGAACLYIGAENWPFPVPLVSQDGEWRFDSDAGAREIRFRRIGENEFAAMGLSRSLVAAGKVENATTPVHGYYFRAVPDSSHHSAVVAYPAEYRSSGVMTFFVNQNGEVREKDLGPDTVQIAPTIGAHGADSTWNLVNVP
jgi:hypothetical protein